MRSWPSAATPVVMLQAKIHHLRVDSFIRSSSASLINLFLNSTIPERFLASSLVAITDASNHSIQPKFTWTMRKSECYS